MKELALLKILNENQNWEEILSGHPYFLRIKKKGRYFSLNYKMHKSNFCFREVQEARGSIFYIKESGEIECVCLPFIKFFNYGEGNAAEIDWNSASVLEKIDGSITKLWYHNEEWHLSTNGMIDANEAMSNETRSFASIFWEAMPLKESFLDALNKDWTYIFELTSPYSQVVIPYDTAIYLIGIRDNKTLEEKNIFENYNLNEFGVRLPKVYSLATLEDCIAVANSFSKDQEGFVVVDKNFERIKIKGNEYLIAARLSSENSNIKPSDIVTVILESKTDDFLAYSPQYAWDVSFLTELLQGKCRQCIQDWESIKHLSGNRKEFALAALKKTNSGFLFEKLKRPHLSPWEYLASLPPKKVLQLLDQ